jgi:hypothetical protein
MHSMFSMVKPESVTMKLKENMKVEDNVETLS